MMLPIFLNSSSFEGPWTRRSWFTKTHSTRCSYDTASNLTCYLTAAPVSIFLTRELKQSSDLHTRLRSTAAGSQTISKQYMQTYASTGRRHHLHLANFWSKSNFQFGVENAGQDIATARYDID